MAEQAACGGNLTSLLLPNDHPKVMHYLEQMNNKRHQKRTVKEDRDRLRTGQGWEACFKRVQGVRDLLAAEFGKQAPHLTSVS